MCTYSMIVRTVEDQWKDRYPYPNKIYPLQPEVSREEFEALRKEVKELVKLLKAAKAYDTATGQTDCEDIDKAQLIKDLATILGIDISGL